jgi:DNA polymerase type B, organellar and viral
MLAESKRIGPAIHVGFVFSYDVNMILGNVPRYKIKELWEADGFAPYVLLKSGHEVFYRPRKSFGVRRGQWEYENEEWKRITTYRILVWDVFGFFQGSFLEILRKWVPEHPYIRRIGRGKEHRHSFSVRELPEIVGYCQAECTALVDVMNAFRESLKPTELKPTRWDGAGALAASLMKSREIKKHLQPPPPEVERVARYAYFGGRMEVLQYGNHRGPVYYYDINSAYPAAMLELPSLSGEWVHDATFGNPSPRAQFSLTRVQFNAAKSQPLHPLPFREFQGDVFFPRDGEQRSGDWRNESFEGWYWEPEAFLVLGHDGHRLETWNFYPATTYRPYNFLPELFEQRRKWQADGNPAEKPLKLAINSLYGKHAQQLGWNQQTGEPPPFHSLVYAGYITSRTRARLYQAAMQKPDSIIMLATDGLWSTEPLDLPLGDGLGEWEHKKFDGLTVVQSGVYWVKEGRKWNLFCRGYDKDAAELRRSSVLTAWKGGLSHIQVPTTRFCGMGTALAGGGAWAKWRKWDSDPRDLALRMIDTKREDVEAHWRTGLNLPRPHRGLVRTRAAKLYSHNKLSFPYSLAWAKGEAKFEGLELAAEHLDSVTE